MIRSDMFQLANDNKSVTDGVEFRFVDLLLRESGQVGTRQFVKSRGHF